VSAATPPEASDTRLRYQRCTACGQTWYFQRTFCPACGVADPLTLAAEGAGTLYASTLVHRAPSDEFKPLLPFTLVLVDMREGFRVMGHAHADLPLDSAVRGDLQLIAGRLLPLFQKDPDAH
jgi:uncharacterized OB-fold protein